jgi:hypothetical protein
MCPRTREKLEQSKPLPQQGDERPAQGRLHRTIAETLVSGTATQTRRLSASTDEHSSTLHRVSRYADGRLRHWLVALCYLAALRWAAWSISSCPPSSLVRGKGRRQIFWALCGARRPTPAPPPPPPFQSAAAPRVDSCCLCAVVRIPCRAG